MPLDDYLYLDTENKLYLQGAWHTKTLAFIETQVRNHCHPEYLQSVTHIHADITHLDTNAAYLLVKLCRYFNLDPEGLTKEQQQTFTLVTAHLSPIPANQNNLPWLASFGKACLSPILQAKAMLAFLGEMSWALAEQIRQPSKIRLGLILSVIENAGAYAIPIISLLSFLMGAVIAYQGGLQLQTYGANIFIVELVSLTLLRELAPLITAIIVAGRSGSAFTAEIATMSINDEIRAMQSLGLSPQHILVLPKVMGLIFVLPLLTALADVAGLAGGMLVALLQLDVSFSEFLQRVPETVSVNHFLVGISKSFAFAWIIAHVGCMQGFYVQGGADSVGRQTTKSVVQSIFLVILADALFSILFTWLKI
ncbi:phospholipid/cholesterol/gamma-HCH transport system permease protein [Allopseudospirillum japonicum]|uniref:Phospholipid/cholesterol/gamma-HCH transport system permease protein n=1 Tax=Allopseudospirillum japonicum TaxID=64971 RepID=A0A1H6RZX5_9GAMM|nr:ABC transporter permease [Allopseudospirillum japonicum]SEI61251.1 phospholipid/cholesterol/gamma-HCH transport system permease protein [Allopseudospirillum japonicum]